ncbi:MAG: cell division topological specificity factor MinE, partial [Lachnospiraceae bacterium]|nr:cell division topological specificity factor MinE [Lachnospiraceae bacterium]
MLRKSSVSIAKDRVKALVVSDRVHCTPDVYDNICRELF